MTSPDATRAGYPRAVYVELTDGCNLKCPMCRCAVIKGDVLPLSMFEEIAAELLPHAAFVDLRGWGESTILPNFFAYLDVAQRYTTRVKLISNGTVGRAGLWERLGADGVVVGISFDAATPPTFARLRGGARMDRVVDNVRRLVSASRGAGFDPAERIYLCITVGGENLDEVPAIIELGLLLGLRRFKLEPLFTTPTDPARLTEHRERIAALSEQLAGLARERGANIEYSGALHPDFTVHDATRKVCIHPWDYCYVNARGRLGFCDHLNGREEFTWGEWGAQPFLEFWNGERMRQLRAEHLVRIDGPQISSCGDCNWCYDHRYVDLEEWIDPSWAAYRVTA